MARPAGRAPGSPSDVLWYAVGFLIERAELHVLRQLLRQLVNMRTSSAVRAMVEDELRKRLA